MFVNQLKEKKLFELSNSINDDIDIDKNKRSIIKSTKDINYFDFIYENDKNNIIVNVDRHIYYRDVFVFIDRFKNLEKNSLKTRIKKFVASCLRDDI